jgi:putative transposase
MRRAGLSGLLIRRRGTTTIRVPGVRPAPDLVRRDFNPAAPNALWVADLTEIATWEGKLYLAVVVDCYSRRCVGWAMAEHMRAELVVAALEMAVWQRKPAPGVIHHSDQGSQYTALIFGQRCRQAGIDVSMGAQGSALDNAVCEAFFASLKKELTRQRSWPTRRELQTAIFAWIEGWYNRRRLHSTLDYLSPADYENRTLSERGASLAASRLAHSPIMIKDKAA